MSKSAILLKITGTIFRDSSTWQFNRTVADELAQQIKTLQKDYNFGIVIGGGSFFRGNENNGITLRPTTAHTIGMVATVISSLMLYDIFHEHGIKSTLLCFNCPLAGPFPSQGAIDQALADNRVIIFGGGTGNPFVSTDTAAVIRARQLNAAQLWKATDVDGVYSTDPHLDTTAKLIKKLSYQEVLDKQLRFIDYTAITLAQQEKLAIKIFNIFSPHALLDAANNQQYGTMITE